MTSGSQSPLRALKSCRRNLGFLNFTLIRAMDSETADQGERRKILTVGDIKVATKCYQLKRN